MLSILGIKLKISRLNETTLKLEKKKEDITRFKKDHQRVKQFHTIAKRF